MSESATANKLELTVRKTLPASREKCFDAWTKQEHLKHWWGKPGWKTAVAEVDLKVGGRYRLGMQPPEADAPYVCTGEFKAIDRPNKVSYTWAWEHDDNPEVTLVTVEFVEKGEHTEMVLHHTGFSREEARDSHNEGWLAVTEACLQYLA